MLYSFAILYVFITALSSILIQHAGITMNPAFTLFFGTVNAIIFFHAINFRHLKKMYQLAFNNLKNWLFIMVTVAIIWLACIYGPTLVSPSIFVLLYFFTLGLTSIVYDSKNDISFFNVIPTIGIFICTLYIVKIYLGNIILSKEIYFGFFLGFLAGISYFIYSKLSFALFKNTSLSVTQLLAVRFWLVLIFCLPLMKEIHSQEINLNNLVLIFAISLCSLILPVFFSTKSIEVIGAEKSAIIFSYIPTITYILEITYMPINISYNLLSLFFASSFFMSLPSILAYIKKMKKKI